MVWPGRGQRWQEYKPVEKAYDIWLVEIVSKQHYDQKIRKIVCTQGA